jgi:S1-C subfamily serine protease
MAGLLIGACVAVIGLSAETLTSPRDIEPLAAPADTDVLTAVAGAVEIRQHDLTPASLGDLLVVKVSVTACGDRSSATGVVIGEGLIITAAHVVGDAGLVRIDGPSTITGEVLGVFADGRDLALIEVDTGAIAAPTLASAPELGDPITVVGYPGGGARTTTVGPHVDAPDLAAQLFRGALVGLDADIGVGFSGGPAVDADGNLIGIVVGAETATGMGIVSVLGDPIDADTPLLEGRCQGEA